MIVLPRAPRLYSLGCCASAELCTAHVRRCGAAMYGEQSYEYDTSRAYNDASCVYIRSSFAIDCAAASMLVLSRLDRSHLTLDLCLVSRHWRAVSKLKWRAHYVMSDGHIHNASSMRNVILEPPLPPIVSELSIVHGNATARALAIVPLARVTAPFGVQLGSVAVVLAIAPLALIRYPCTRSTTVNRLAAIL